MCESFQRCAQRAVACDSKFKRCVVRHERKRSNRVLKALLLNESADRQRDHVRVWCRMARVTWSKRTGIDPEVLCDDAIWWGAEVDKSCRQIV